MLKRNRIISAVSAIALGLLFIILKGEVIGIGITVFGLAAIIMAILDFVNGFAAVGAVKGVVGICILVFGWMFINLALYILAAGIIIFGLLQIIGTHRIGTVFLTSRESVMAYIRPVLTISVGALLLFHQDGVIDWLFIVTGILLAAEGVLDLLCRKN